ncbi:hypothetical protein BJV74DRAFT_797287 [Russula compacta]|nr:hypothetical protein BJV74DRAFT_797287 [Russula compacta]
MFVRPGILEIPPKKYEAQGAARQVDAGQGAGTGRGVWVGRCRQGQPQQAWPGTWTQTWADWKHEHKNKVKKVKTTHQTHCGGRQAGVATTGRRKHRKLGRAWCSQVGGGIDRHSQAQAGVGKREKILTHTHGAGPVVWLSTALAIG